MADATVPFLLIRLFVYVKLRTRACMRVRVCACHCLCERMSVWAAYFIIGMSSFIYRAPSHLVADPTCILYPSNPHIALPCIQMAAPPTVSIADIQAGTEEKFKRWKQQEEKPDSHEKMYYDKRVDGMPFFFCSGKCLPTFLFLLLITNETKGKYTKLCMRLYIGFSSSSLGVFFSLLYLFGWKWWCTWALLPQHQRQTEATTTSKTNIFFYIKTFTQFTVFKSNQINVGLGQQII